MMRSSLLALAAMLACAVPAAAQDSRVFANINFGYQVQDQDFRQTAEFPLYDETGTWEAAHSVEGGALFDVGVGYRLFPRTSVGVAYTNRFKHTRDVALNASVPSPIFTDTFRGATGSANGLEHSEQAVHLQALWHVPVTVEFDVTLFAGPTFFRVEDSLVADVAFDEVGGDFSTVNIASVSTADRSGSTVGFHLGIDTRYMFMRNVGLGAMLRYSRGSLDLDGPSGSGAAPVDITAGGLEFAAGLRFSF